jgi:hypothetical protein
MNLTLVLHQRWAADSALSAALSASRVFTGPSVDPNTPFALITRRATRPDALFNDGSGVDTIDVRIELYHHSYDAALNVRDQIAAAFDRASFDLSGADRVLVMRRAGENERQGDDGVWRLTLDFQCTVYLNSGA